jgi:hypothetical protein
VFHVKYGLTLYVIFLRNPAFGLLVDLSGSQHGIWVPPSCLSMVTEALSPGTRQLADLTDYCFHRRHATLPPLFYVLVVLDMSVI